MNSIIREPIQIKDRMHTIFDQQQATALRLRTSTAQERITKIRKLRDAVIAYSDELYKAAYADFK